LKGNDHSLFHVKPLAVGANGTLGERVQANQPLRMS
jgi:hypothetical protein